MFRLNALTVIVILLAVQLSTIECKKDKGNKGKKNKGCTYNAVTYEPDETVLTDESHCIELICKGKSKDKGKGNQRKKGGGKGKGKGKGSIVPQPIEDCDPIQCMDMPVPCGNGRCVLPPTEGGPSEPGDKEDGKKDKCDDQNLSCPKKWKCTAEKYTDPDSGCTKCRCKREDPGYESLCGPIPAPCPMDCGIMITIDKKTGCTVCICDPEDTDNPFVQPTVGAVESRPSSVSWNDGCNDCTCMNGMPVCTEKGCPEDEITEDSAICKNGCSKEKMEVCGTDGITYDNSCLLDFARLCKDQNVQLNFTGPCECKACNKRKYDPVCGDDCKTYSNACMLSFANCKNGRNVKQVKKGKCEADKISTLRSRREIRRRIEKKGASFLVPRRKIQGRKGKKQDISGTRKMDEMVVMKKKKKAKKCEYNRKKLKVNSEVDLGIDCLQLKCIKKENKPALEIQYKSGCKCNRAVALPLVNNLDTFYIIPT